MHPVGVLALCSGLGIAFLMILATVLVEYERQIAYFEWQLASVKRSAKRYAFHQHTKRVVQNEVNKSKPRQTEKTTSKKRSVNTKKI